MPPVQPTPGVCPRPGARAPDPDVGPPDCMCCWVHPGGPIVPATPAAPNGAPRVRTLGCSTGITRRLFFGSLARACV